MAIVALSTVLLKDVGANHAENSSLQRIHPRQESPTVPPSRELSHFLHTSSRPDPLADGSDGLSLSPDERLWLASLPPLKLGIDPDWAPIAYIDANGQASGIVADYLKNISRSLGVRFALVKTSSWEEALSLARSGQLDVVAPVNTLTQRDPVLQDSRPLITLPDVIVTRPSASPQGIEDLAGRQVMISDSSELPYAVRRQMPDARVVVARNAFLAMKAVAEGQADAYIGNAAIVDFNVRNYFDGALKIAAPANVSSTLSIAVNRRYARLMPMIDRAIAAIPGKEQRRIRSTWLWPRHSTGLPWKTFWKVVALTILIVGLVLAIIIVAYIRLRHEVRQRLAVEQDLADQLSFREALMESLPYPLAAKDSAHRYLAINRAYETAFSVKRQSLIGKTAPEAAPLEPALRTQIHAMSMKVQQQRYPHHAEVTLLDDQRNRRSWLYWMHPFQLPSGKPGGTLVALVDVTTIREAEQRAQVLDQRLRRVTTHLPAVVFELRRSPDGKFSFPYVGGNTDAMWDLDAAVMEGNTYEVLSRVHPGDRSHVQAAIEYSARTLEPISIDFRCLAHDRERWIHTEATPQAEEDRTIFWSGLWSDITDAKAQAQELASAKDEAEAAAACKASFLATMSHEIRTPMNGVISVLELLRDEPLNARQQRMLHMIGESAKALMQILDDILDFSKIDAGQMEIVAEPTNLRALLDSVSGIAAALAHDKGLLVRNVVSARLAAELEIDGARLRQILLNLLSNATKFTEYGEIGVHIDVIDCRHARQHVRLTVHDTGIGMTAMQQRHLFEPFVQADISIARRFGGTGLGLTICKRLVELMGGAISIESAPGTGTRVIVAFELPVHRLVRSTPLAGKRARIDLPDEAQAMALRELLTPLGMVLTLRHEPADVCFVDECQLEEIDFDAPIIVITEEPSPLGYEIAHDGMRLLSRNPLMSTAVEALCLDVLLISKPALSIAALPSKVNHPARILVVEDHPINRQAIGAQLERLGYSAVVVSSGMEALRVLDNTDISLVISDCAMPGMDGYTLAKHIRARACGRRHVPILAWTASAMPDEAIRCVEAGMDGLLVKPTTLTALHEQLAHWLGTACRKASTLATPPHVLTASPEWGDSYSTLIKGFLTETAADLDHLRAAVRDGDAVAAADRIHRIGGASKLLGGDALADLGEKLRMELLSSGALSDEATLAAFYAEVERLVDVLKDTGGVNPRRSIDR
ncbi:ATP-binding protein [Burkholderia gladioli]|uniref:ATP-binding protein n=1 Tax=Burkholderia gladioli TaxID=28095 RepID=UPI003F7ADD5A